MSIVGLIGGTYYDVLHLDSLGNPQPFNVPAGIVDEPRTLVVNNDPALKVSGEGTFCVNVTNNVTEQNSKNANFRTAESGFLPVLSFIREPEDEWVPSQGFEFEDREDASRG